LFRKLALILVLSLGICIQSVHAQTDSSNQHQAARDSLQPKTSSRLNWNTSALDLGDVWKSINKRHPDPNAAGEKPIKYHLSPVAAIGNTYSTGWALILALNLGFYTYDSTTTNISSISASFVYSQYNQTTISTQANLWSKNNRYNYVMDWRYYQYPQDTYGLGGHSALQDADLIDYSHIRIHQSVLKNVATNVYAGAGYFLDYHWNVKEFGQSNGDSSDALKYGLPATAMSSGPVLNVLYDNRNNSINPKGGLYANALYRNNFKALGSDGNWQSLTLDVRKYFRLPGSMGNVLAVWSYDWLTLQGKPPYLDLPSTGWDAYNNTGRGYIQGRFRGANMIYLETEYRFGITRNGLFGGVLFANAESFSEYPDNKFAAIWPGLGLGVRIKVSKRSGANLALDYGFGADGSHGLYVNLGEVF